MRRCLTVLTALTTCVLLANVTAALAYAGSAATVLASDVIDDRTVYCVDEDKCSFEQQVLLGERSTTTSLVLESATVSKTGSSMIDARSGFRLVVAIPAKTRSVSVTLNWADVTGSASAIGGSWLTGLNQTQVILVAWSDGCTGCTVIDDDGSGPDGSGNAILLASSAKPTGSIGDPSLTRTVQARAGSGYLPSQLVFRTFLFSRSDLPQPGRVAATYQGRLAGVLQHGGDRAAAAVEVFPAHGVSPALAVVDVTYRPSRAENGS